MKLVNFIEKLLTDHLTIFSTINFICNSPVGKTEILEKSLFQTRTSTSLIIKSGRNPFGTILVHFWGRVFIDETVNCLLNNESHPHPSGRQASPIVIDSSSQSNHCTHTYTERLTFDLLKMLRPFHVKTQCDIP